MQPRKIFPLCFQKNMGFDASSCSFFESYTSLSETLSIPTLLQLWKPGPDTYFYSLSYFPLLIYLVSTYMLRYFGLALCYFSTLGRQPLLPMGVSFGTYGNLLNHSHFRQRCLIYGENCDTDILDDQQLTHTTNTSSCVFGSGCTFTGVPCLKAMA